MKVQDFLNFCKDSLGCFVVGVVVGVIFDMMACVEVLVKVGVDVVIIDMAYGYFVGVFNVVKDVKGYFFDFQVIGGNVVIGFGVLVLAEVGVDGIKVGVGLGFICIIWIVVGVGVFQFIVINDVYEVVKYFGVLIVGDGGICYIGDIVKVLVVGVNIIMVGGLFVGVEEVLGEMIIYEGWKFKVYCGMGFISVMEKGFKDWYFQDVEDDIKKLVLEGIEGCVFYKGIVVEVMVQYLGGLWVGMGYCGVVIVEDLQYVQFVWIISSGILESYLYNIIIIKELLNYSCW